MSSIDEQVNFLIDSLALLNKLYKREQDFHIRRDLAYTITIISRLKILFNFTVDEIDFFYKRTKNLIKAIDFFGNRFGKVITIVSRNNVKLKLI